MKKITLISIVAACLGVFTGTASAQVPGNDDFANATNLPGASGTVNGTNVNATPQSGDPTAGNSVWYNWTAPQSGSVTFNTGTTGTGTLDDTILFVYSGAALNSLTPVAFNDDGKFDTRSFVTFSASAGVTYRIAITGYQGASGTFPLNYLQIPNDDFANGQVIAGASGSVLGADVDATSEGLLEDENTPVIWYSWTAPITGVVQFSVPDDTGHFVDIFRGTTYGNKVSLTGNTVMSINGDPAPLAPGVQALVSAGTVYRIAVGGGGADFTLAWQTTTNGILSFTGTKPYFDMNYFSDRERFVADEKGGPITVKVRRTGGLDGTVSATYQVKADTDGEFDLTDAEAGTDFTAATGTVTFQPGEAEKTFTVAIINDTEEEDTEDFVIKLSNPTGGALLGTAVAQAHIFDDENDPANDDFVNAQPIFGTTGSVIGDNSLADVEATEPPFTVGVAGVVDNLGANIWYRWTPPASGVAEFSALINGNMEAETIDVYTTGAGGLQSVAHGGLLFDTEFNGAYKRTVFNAEAGQVYYIRLDGSSAYGDYGSTELIWSIATGGIVSFGPQTFEVTEKTGAVYQVVIQRQGGLANGASVSLSTTDNSAEGLVDYTPVETTVVFNPGESTKTVSIPILNDSDLEGDEFFDLNLFDASGAILGEATTASVTIFDDEDDPENDLFIARIALGATGVESGTTEGAGPEDGEPNHGRFSVWYQWTSPIGAPGVATFSLGGSSVMSGPTVTVYTGSTLNGLTKVTQGLDEASFLTTPNTAYVIAITDTGIDNGAGGLDFSPSAFDLSYSFDPSGSVIGFANASISVAETTTTLTVSLTRSGSTAGVSTVDFDVMDNTAVVDEDYTYTPDTVTFAAGQTTKTFTVNILNDTLKEGDETFSPYLYNATNAVLAPGGGQLATVTILDDDDDIVPPPNDNFAAAVLLTGSNPTVEGFTEGATVEASEPTVAGAAPNSSVWYKWVAPGNGAARLSLNTTTHFTSAYTGTSLANLAQVTFASPGAFAVTSGTTYYVPVNATAGSVFDLTINFSAAGVFSLNSSTLSAREDSGSAPVTIQRTNGSTGAATVRFRTESLTALAGSDFTAVDTVVNFASGVSSQVVNVPLINDALEEGPETVRLILSDATGGAITAYGPDQVVTLLIQDDETAPDNDNLATAIALSGPFGTTFGSNIDGSTEGGEPIHAAAGTGASIWYRWTAPANGTVTFQTTGSAIPTVLAAYTGTTVGALNPVASSASNPSSISFTAVGGTSYAIAVDSAGAGRGSISLGWNLLLPGVLGFSPSSYSLSEGAASVVLTVARGVGADGSVSVNFTTADGSAVAGQDYTATSGSLVFGPGETTKTITVPVLNDTAFETAESFTVVLSAPTNGAIVDGATATIALASNDPFVPALTNYAALINPGGAHNASGLLTVSLSASATFSGKVIIGGKTYKFKGAFDSFGAAIVSIARKGLPTLSIGLQIANGGEGLTGHVYDSSFDSAFNGEASFFNKTDNPTPRAGTYTLALAPTAVGAAIPQGYGTATMKVSPAGVITIKAGQLGDNAKLDATGFIAKSGKVQFYSLLYKGLGSLSGVVTFRNETLTDADGTLAWFKPGNVPKATFFAAGITTNVDFKSSRHEPAAAGGRVDTAFDANNGATTVVLSGGGLAAPVTITGPLSTKNVLSVTTPAAFTLTGNGKTGVFGGSFTPASGVKGPIRGVFLQKANKAYGQFFGTSLGGSIEVTPSGP